MILTPIARDELVPALDRFEAGLRDPTTRHIFRQIRTTAPHRASDARAESHRLRALALARQFGVPVHPPGTRCRFNWMGRRSTGRPRPTSFCTKSLISCWPRPSAAPWSISAWVRGRTRATAMLQSGRRCCRSRRARKTKPRPRSWASCGKRRSTSRRSPRFSTNWLEGLDRRAADHFTRVLAGLRRAGAARSAAAIRGRAVA